MQHAYGSTKWTWVFMAAVSMASHGCAGPGPQQELSSAADTAAYSAPGGSVLVGLHSPPWDDPDTLDVLFASRRGWLLDVTYSTDIDWVGGAAVRFQRAATRGHNVVVRVDYARPDGTAWADGSALNGATVPPPGHAGYCPVRATRDGAGNLVEMGPSRQAGDGSHLDCYLAYLDDMIANTPDVHAWIVGNEMNLEFEGKGFAGGFIPPSWYADVYAAARARILGHPGHGDDLVMMGAVSPGDAGGDRVMSGDGYLSAMLAGRAADEIGGIAIHAYGGWPQVQHNGGVPAISLFESTYRAQLETIDALGFACAPVLLTEFSVHMHLNDPAIDDAPHASAFLRDAVAGIHAWNEDPARHALLGAVWFTWNDPWSFAEESLAPFHAKRGQAGQAADNNPALQFTSLASIYPAGRAGVGACSDTPPSWPEPEPDPEPDPEPTCPCLPQFDNVCFYAADYPGCQALLGVVTCQSDEQWAHGWYLANDPSEPGFVCHGAPAIPSSSCPCQPGVDNFCSYGPSYAGCSMTQPGGYCDPDGDGSFQDGDWVRGYYDYHAACGS